MIIIDENFPDSQRQLLRGWRISFKQVAVEIGRGGMKDDEIIPMLHQLKQVTFFTLDDDFFRPDLRHAGYCLIYLDVSQYESAAFIRRVLHHPEQNTKKKRMGRVIRLSHAGLFIWELHHAEKLAYTLRNIGQDLFDIDAFLGEARRLRELTAEYLVTDERLTSAKTENQP